MADQTASSLTNFALGVLVAREATTAGFGAFSLAFVTYLLFQNIGRAIVAQPLLIRYSTTTADDWRAGASRGTGAALVLGVVSGAGTIVAGWVAGGDLGVALIGLGLGMPALLVQDAWRFAFIAAGRSRDAFLNDGLRLILLVPGIAALGAVNVHPVLGPLVVWGLGAAIAAVIGAVQSKASPAWTSFRPWMTEHRDLTPRFVAESLTTVGSLQLTYFAIGALGGLTVLGAIRAAELLLGPYNVFSLGILLVAVPEATRVLQSSTAELVRLCMVIGVALAGAAIALGLALLVLPDAIGHAVVGDSWEAARSVLIPLSAATAATMAASAAGTGLRALEAAGRVLRAALVFGVALLVATTVGVWAAGLPGAAWGMVAGSSIGLAVYWWELLDAAGRRTAGGVT